MPSNRKHPISSKIRCLKKEQSKITSKEEHSLRYHGEDHHHFLSNHTDQLEYTRRIKRNNRTTLLFSTYFLQKYLPILINNIEKINGRLLSAKGRTACEKAVKSLHNIYFKKMEYSQLPDMNPYDTYQCLVKAVRDVTTEHNISPADLHLHKSIADEVIRRVYTKEQYTDICKKRINELTDADKMVEDYLRPGLELYFASHDMEKDTSVETKAIPFFRMRTEMSAQIVSVWFDEEITRIYA